MIKQKRSGYKSKIMDVRCNLYKQKQRDYKQGLTKFRAQDIK